MDLESADLTGLIEHLLVRFHEPAYEDFDAISGLVDRVTRAHGHQDPERFQALERTWATLRGELIPHFRKEETILFPMLLRLDGAAAPASNGAHAAGPIQVMRHEHDGARHLLQQIRELCDDYDMPPEACPSWRSLYVALESFERTLIEHIRIENDVLFVRVGC